MAELSELIAQIRGILAEDGDLAGKTDKPARMAKVLRAVKAGGAGGGTSGGHEETHKQARLKAQGHEKLSGEHAKAGNHKQAAQHASAASAEYDKAHKAAKAMGFDGIAAKHQDDSHKMRVAAYDHLHQKKPGAKK